MKQQAVHAAFSECDNKAGTGSGAEGEERSLSGPVQESTEDQESAGPGGSPATEKRAALAASVAWVVPHLPFLHPPALSGLHKVHKEYHEYREVNS